MRECNWADNYTFGATRVHRPTSVPDVRRIVAGASRVHAVGTRHSFNGVADSPGDMIELGGLDPDIVIDPANGSATVSAGTSYDVLAAHLEREGWALHNMASLPHISVAGATATGTHGSGDALGNLATAVQGLEIVTATGDMLCVRRGETAFDGMVVNLGALGVVTRLTLDIQPSFEMRQDAFEGLPWDRLIEDLDAVMGAGYSVSLMTTWSGDTVTRMWLKTRLPSDKPPEQSAAELGATPAAHPSAGGTLEGLARLNPFGQPGPWSRTLPHFRPGVEPGMLGHLQSEYMVPRARAAEAINALRLIGRSIDEHLLTSEIRSMTGDPLWLSPAYGHDSIALHFSWKRDLVAVPLLTADIEARLLPLGGRPHWGKIMHTGAGMLAPLYPRMTAFRELAHSVDPGGKFRNAFLDKHVFA